MIYGRLSCSFTFWERLCENEGIGNGNYKHHQLKDETFLYGQPCLICEAACDVDCGVGDNAGQQAFAAVKEDYEQKADCDCCRDLNEIFRYSCAAAVHQVQHMPRAKSDAGDDNRRTTAC